MVLQLKPLLLQRVLHLDIGPKHAFRVPEPAHQLVLAVGVRRPLQQERVHLPLRVVEPGEQPLPALLARPDVLPDPLPPRARSIRVQPLPRLDGQVQLLQAMLLLGEEDLDEGPLLLHGVLVPHPLLAGLQALGRQLQPLLELAQAVVVGVVFVHVLLPLVDQVLEEIKRFVEVIWVWLNV